MINVNYIGSMYISNTINGRRERVPEPVPAGNGFPPTSQEYSIYIHTTYIQIIINTIGFRGNGFPPCLPEPVPADRYAYVYGVLDICQREIAN